MSQPHTALWQPRPQLSPCSDRSFLTNDANTLIAWLRNKGFQPIALSQNPAELQRLRKGAMLVVIYRSGSLVCQGDAWQQLARLLRSLPTAYAMFGGQV